MRTLVAVLSLAAAILAQEPREDWIQEDLAVVATVAAAWPETDAAAFFAALGAPVEPEHDDELDEFEDRAVGFGARRREVSVPGGYTTAVVRTLAIGGRLAAADVRFDVGGSEHRGAIRGRLLAAWRAAADADARVLGAARYDRALLAGHAEAIARQLGAAPPRPEDEALRPVLAAARSTLMDPLDDLLFGMCCFESAEPPPGRLEIDVLVAARQFDVIREVLRSPNPEARVYAADALLRADIWRSAADYAAIARIRQLPIPIVCCEGCFVSTRHATEILPEVR